MKPLASLPKDIYKLFEEGVSLTEEQKKELGESMVNAIAPAMEPKAQREGYLRMSNFGTPCDRKLWYSVNKPEMAEPPDGKALFKFMYGHIIEAYTLFLTKLTGRKVEGEQDRVELNGVVGHRDAVIDGILVDVKSASSRGMAKFKEHSLDHDDPFGYRDQLDLYREAGRDDPLVTVKGEAAFIAVDKEMGNIVIDTYKKQDKDWDTVIQEKKDMVASEDPPKRRYDPIADGQSGNQKLCMECSYCPYKETCWPGLRTFIYSNGPRFLTKVVRTPDVYEVPKKDVSPLSNEVRQKETFAT